MLFIISCWYSSEYITSIESIIRFLILIFRSLLLKTPQIWVICNFLHLCENTIHYWIQTLHNIQSLFKILNNWNLCSNILNPLSYILNLKWIVIFKIFTMSFNVIAKWNQFIFHLFDNCFLLIFFAIFNKVLKFFQSFELSNNCHLSLTYFGGHIWSRVDLWKSLSEHIWFPIMNSMAMMFF